jgi:hypothetical protein
MTQAGIVAGSSPGSTLISEMVLTSTATFGAPSNN